MSDVAANPEIQRNYPLIADSLKLAASPQLRNMASLGGNVLQRTRCTYFRDVSYDNCNKRNPGSGCAAMDGFNRTHAVLGTSDQCIATYPGDFAQALIALDATVEITGKSGVRPSFAELHKPPGNSPDIETILAPGELISGFLIAGRWPRSVYLKARDRQSYEFALASAAIALDVQDGMIRDARVGLGGVATVPWRARAGRGAAEGPKIRRRARRPRRRSCLHRRKARQHNAFKIALGKRVVSRALASSRNDGDLRCRSPRPSRKPTWASPFRATTPSPRLPAKRNMLPMCPGPIRSIAYLVTSSIAKGRIDGIDLVAAKRVRGVIDIVTHENAEKLKDAKLFSNGGYASSTIQPLKSPEIAHEGQIVAVVLGRDLRIGAASRACREGELCRCHSDHHVFDSPGTTSAPAKGQFAQFKEDPKVGDFAKAFDEAEVKITASLRNPDRSTTTRWNCSRPVACGTATSSPSTSRSQYVHGLKNGVAEQLGIDADKVRVINAYVGGAFGSKGSMTPRTAIIAASRGGWAARSSWSPPATRALRSRPSAPRPATRSSSAPAVTAS